MSNRLVSEDTVARLSDLIEYTRMKVWKIEADVENDSTPATWVKYEKEFEQLNSFLRRLEEIIKYL